MLEKLLTYMKTLNLTLQLCPQHNGAFLPKSRIIQLPDQLSEEKKIVYLAHELGHALTPGIDTIKNVSPKQCLELEHQAWERSEELLKALGYQNWDCWNRVKAHSFDILVRIEKGKNE